MPPLPTVPPRGGATTKYTFAQIEGLWIRNGGSRALAPIMAAIAYAESRGIVTNVYNNPKTGDLSYGLWQINYFGKLGPERTAEFGTPDQLLKDPNRQAKAAIALAQNGRGLFNWSTWKNKNPNDQQSFLYWLNKNKGVKPATPPDSPIVTLPSPGDIAGGIANALIPDWINKHNTVRFGQGFMGFVLIIVGVIVLAREGSRSAPAAAVADVGSGVGAAATGAAGAATLAGRRAQGKATRPVYRPARQTRTPTEKVPGVMGRNGGRMLRDDEPIPF